MPRHGIDDSASVLFRFTDRLYRSTDIRAIYDAALDAILAALQCERAAILLTDEAGVMRFVAWRGLSDGYRAAVEGHSPWKLDDPDPQPVAINDVRMADLGAALKKTVLGEGIRALCFIPMMAGGRLIGKFMTYYGDPHVFDRAEHELGQLIAHQLSFSIERQHIERLRSEADERLALVARNKDAFLATLGHELRNPLAPILLTLERLDRHPGLPEDAHRMLRVIRRQSNVMLRLVADLLDVARIAENKIDLQLETVDPAALVEMALELSRALVEMKDQHLVVDACSGCARISCDAIRIAQVLSNLINNASKYSERGARIWLGMQCEPDAAVFSVRDEGVGIAPEFLPSMFNLYSQGVQARKQAIGGLGIGLHLVKRLVDLHHGHVSVHSEGAGQGSEFTVRLPLAAGTNP